jgi:imidazolonepropionase-like amidohydrolase
MITLKGWAGAFTAACLGITMAHVAPLLATEREEPRPQILFTNVHIFDGKSEELAEGMSVLVEGNLIKEVSTDAIDAPGATVIDGEGRTLMPGLIDAHTHFTHCVPDAGIDGLEVTHWSEIGAMATVCAKEHLMNGFTTVREMGGGSIGPGLKKAIDAGYIEGPRFYPSGAYISQTSGHADFVPITHHRQEDTNLYRLGIATIADGPDEVRAAVRKQLSLGASQIKLMGGGGVSSLKDPIHSSQYTAEEMMAAVEAAEAFDTYVAGHLYQDVDIRRALENGFLSIEHGQFMTNDTAKLMVEKGAFLSLNLAGTSPDLFKHPVYGAKGTPPYIKSKQFQELAVNLPEILKSNPDMKVVFNTDLVFSAGPDLRRGIDFEKFMHYDLLGPIRALRGMTSTNGELMALSGKMNPYPEGKLGVIEPGAYADILLVDGNPLEDMTVIGANEKWFDAKMRDQDLPTLWLIMKDGVIYKNTL